MGGIGIKAWVLIPAYEPDERLCLLVGELVAAGFPVLAVDDGSVGENCAGVFARTKEAGATVLHHEVNRGKGAAIKTGLSYIASIEDDSPGAVTADADGQHAASDIAAVAEAMDAHPGALVLGVRDFKQMPPRSRAGNTLTRIVYRLTTGLNVTDTQTGLRGLPRELYPRLLELSGERYEYEMNMLLELKRWGAPFSEVTIRTIYIDNNSSSHFHALRDGMRVFSRVLKYALSSLLSTLVDYGLYIFFMLIIGWSEPRAFQLARIISCVINYTMNCVVVFRTKITPANLLGYAALVLFTIVVGSPAILYLTNSGMDGVLAKVIVDVVLFVFNYLIQKSVVFRKSRKDAGR